MQWERSAKERSGADASPSASPARGFAALLLVLGATALMNGSIFPQFDAVFMFARDISVTCSAITLLALGLMAYRAPSALRRGAIIGGAAACIVLGGALLAAGLAWALPALRRPTPRCAWRFRRCCSWCSPPMCLWD